MTLINAESDVGLIGLAVMGQNLVLNMCDHGFRVSIFNRSVDKVDAFLANEGKGFKLVGARDIREFVQSIKRPRRMILMVKAGTAVDDLIQQLLPHLEQGDIIIDAGNSHYEDSMRRCTEIESKGFLYIGTGVSGGEEGARHGPSIMPGGSSAAWPHVKELFQAIAAKAEDGKPCCEWIGSGGSGHFVKMVHNGIEYGDMQVIAESYHFMRDCLAMDNAKIAEMFETWNRGRLDSFLIEITAAILRHKDEKGGYVVDHILDAAGQKGTGKWTINAALDAGMPLTLMSESVMARSLSALRTEREHAEAIFSSQITKAATEKELLLTQIEGAVYGAKLVSYAQGFMLLRSASHEHRWNLNLGSVAGIWRGGCIIRSRFLTQITTAFEHDANMENILLSLYFSAEMQKCVPLMRSAIAQAVLAGVPIPAMGAALSFFDSYRTTRLPTNLIQAQRDYFGAHLYERIDAPRGSFFHTAWTEESGRVTSTHYGV